MMTIVAEDDTKVKDPSEAGLRRQSERISRARPHHSLTAGRIGGRTANSGLQSPISTEVEPAISRSLPVFLTIVPPSQSCLFPPLEGVQPIAGSSRLPYPTASAWSLAEILGFGVLGASALLAVGYGFLCGVGLVSNWALFQAGIERLVQ